MRRNVLSMCNRATYLDQTHNYVLKACSQVLFARAIYHTSKLFCACVGMCACDRTPLLKWPEKANGILTQWSSLIL